jgi:hypothetical protein
MSGHAIAQINSLARYLVSLRPHPDREAGPCQAI